MHTNLKIGTAVILSFVLGSALLPVANAWQTSSMPDCYLETVVGRQNIIIPSQTRGRTESRTDNVEETAEYFFSPRGSFIYTPGGAPFLNVYSWFASQPVIASRTQWYGQTTNAAEARDRLLLGGFSNILKTECRVRYTMYYLGFPMDKPTSAPIDDSAPYNRLDRNHSLYQRTDDLQAEITSLRADIARMAAQLRLSGFSAPVAPTTIAPVVTPNPPVTNPGTTIPSDIRPGAAPTIDTKACSDTCGLNRISCMKSASTGKALQDCSIAEAACSSSCGSASVK